MYFDCGRTSMLCVYEYVHFQVKWTNVWMLFCLTIVLIVSLWFLEQVLCFHSKLIRFVGVVFKWRPRTASCRHWTQTLAASGDIARNRYTFLLTGSVSWNDSWSVVSALPYAVPGDAIMTSHSWMEWNFVGSERKSVRSAPFERVFGE